MRIAWLIVAFLVLSSTTAWAVVTNSPQYQTVQVTVTSSGGGPSACNSTPSWAAAAGYTTQIICNDFTQAIPNSLGTGLAGVAQCSSGSCPNGNWMGCGADQFPETSNNTWWYDTQTWNANSSVSSYAIPCSLIFQTTDPDLGGLALDMQWPSTLDTALGSNFTGPGNVIQMTGEGSNYPIFADYEWDSRVQYHPYNYFGDAGSHCCGPFIYPNGNSAGAYEVDFTEVFPFGWGEDGGSGFSGCCSGPVTTATWNPYTQWDWLFTGNGTIVEQCIFQNKVLYQACQSIPWSSGLVGPYWNFIYWGASNALQCVFATWTDDGICNGGGAYNQAITSIYDCGGAICITVPGSQYVTNGVGNNDCLGGVYITGTGTQIDGFWPWCGLQGQGSSGNPSGDPPYVGPNWQILGTTWPSGGITYSGSGGILNPYTTKDHYTKWIDILSCSNWNNSTGCALGTIITSEADPLHTGRLKLVAKKEDGQEKILADNIKVHDDKTYSLASESGMGRMFPSFRGDGGMLLTDRHGHRYPLVVADDGHPDPVRDSTHDLASLRGVVAYWISHFRHSTEAN